MTPKRFAVIDIGTLKVKLQIVERGKNHGLKTIDQSTVLTCLGVRMSENGNKPLPEYLAQTLEELKRCKGVLEEKHVDRIRVVSTHALREMGPVGEEIARKIRSDVGLPVEIISQQEEAELFYRAVLRDFKTTDDYTVVDVGGGSVQILIGNKKKLKRFYLLKMGPSYLHDRFTPRHEGTDFPSRKEIRAMKKYILNQLSPVPKNLKTPIVYGSSSIIDVFKTLGLKLDKFSDSPSHPYKTSLSEMESFLERVIPIPYDTREEMFKYPQRYYMWGIDKAFLDIVTLGRQVGAPYIVPSNANINQGLLLSLTNG